MADALKLATSSALRLDLACGQSPREGFEGVDLYAPNAQHKVDLWKFPLPWADNSVEEINCSHFVEHIPAREVEDRDSSLPIVRAKVAGNEGADEWRAQWRGRDMMLAFFDECYRILKPDCWMHVVVPSARSNRAFQDPTHRRFIVAETFLYLAAEWRKMNKLDHYNVRCNFACDVNPTIPQELSLRTPEVQGHLINTAWNSTYDWVAKLKALK